MKTINNVNEDNYPDFRKELNLKPINSKQIKKVKQDICDGLITAGNKVVEAMYDNEQRTNN